MDPISFAVIAAVVATMFVTMKPNRKGDVHHVYERVDRARAKAVYQEWAHRYAEERALAYAEEARRRNRPDFAALSVLESS